MRKSCKSSIFILKSIKGTRHQFHRGTLMNIKFRDYNFIIAFLKGIKLLFQYAALKQLNGFGIFSTKNLFICSTSKLAADPLHEGLLHQIKKFTNQKNSVTLSLT